MPSTVTHESLSEQEEEPQNIDTLRIQLTLFARREKRNIWIISYRGVE
jgi:hypothetical protein